MTRRLSSRRTLTGVGLSLLAASIAWLSARGADSPEAREIKARLKKQADRIESLEVSFRHEGTSPLKAEQLLAMAQFRNQLWLPKDRWHVAFKGRKRFRHELNPERLTPLGHTDEFGMSPPPPVDPKSPALVQENQKKLIKEYERAAAMVKAEKARGTKRIRFDNQPDRDVTRAYNSRTLWMRHPESDKVDAYEIWPSNSRANWFQVTPYTQATGLHPPDPTGHAQAVKAQAMFRIGDRVGDHGYQLEDKTEVVDGSTCVVLNGNLNSLLQPGMIVGDLTDRLWLDRDHGLAVRKREFARDGRIGMRWINTELREVEPGLWLPLHCRQETFAEDAPPEWKDKPVMIEEITVSKLEVNKVSDDLFDMNIRKSDHVEDLRGVLSGK
jgi:hypothetical protein